MQLAGPSCSLVNRSGYPDKSETSNLTRARHNSRHFSTSQAQRRAVGATESHEYFTRNIPATVFFILVALRSRCVLVVSLLLEISKWSSRKKVSLEFREKRNTQKTSVSSVLTATFSPAVNSHLFDSDAQLEMRAPPYHKQKKKLNDLAFR